MKKKRGAKVAKYAKPIAKAVDATFGTNWQNCGGCNRMERNLDAGMSWGAAIYDRFWSSEEQPKENNARED